MKINNINETKSNTGGKFSGYSVILLKSFIIMIIIPFIIAFIATIFIEKSFLAFFLCLVGICLCSFLIYIILFFEKLFIKCKEQQISNIRYKNNTITNHPIAVGKTFPIKLNKKYKARAFYTVSNRWKTINNIVALNEDKVRELLDNSGFREPYQIEEIFREPTERQIEYAIYLGIKIPKGASLEDVSSLISMNKDEDTPSDIGLIEFSSEKDLYISRYIGKKALYNHIFLNLILEDKIAFFIFCIYRWLSDDSEINLNKSIYKDLFYEFSNKMLKDKDFIKSLNRYNGESLIWFGTFRYQWNDYSGGSKNTKAYKLCVHFLEDKLGILSDRSNTINPNIKEIKKEMFTDYRYDDFTPIRDSKL